MLTPYEADQVAKIAVWKARTPGLLRRTVETLKAPLDHLFERALPAVEARKLLTRLHNAADWKHGRDQIQHALGIDDLAALRNGTLERCDGLMKKVKDLSREIITSESLLANVGGIATELLELPAELMLALRSVHRVAACYGYELRLQEDETLVLAIMGLSLLDTPDDRVRAMALIRELEEGKCRPEDQDRLGAMTQARIQDEVADDLVEEIGSTLLEEKAGEGIPFLGAALGVVLDNAFISGVEEAAQCVFRERWLREHGKIDTIAPAESSHLSSSFGAGLNRAVYSTSYALSFGIVFPAALIAQAGEAVLPMEVSDGMRNGASAAARDAGRLLSRSRATGTAAQAKAE
jgi:hypothetical protein